jgi:hypothetical protein
MGDRRPKKRPKKQTGDQPARPDVFAECGLNYADFDVASGGGKSFLSGQRIVWMTVTHRPTGRTVSGKIGTTKKGADRQHDALLRELLRSFRRT